MITQETYEELRRMIEKLFFDKRQTRLSKVLYAGTIEDLFDLLDTTIREFEGQNEIQNAPERIFLNIGEDTPDGSDFNELDGITWSKERVSNKDIEYVRKEA